MGSGAQLNLRTPLILLAAINLALLSMLLWPWQQVLNLPGNGTIAIDPAVCLVAYIGLIFFIGGNRHEPIQKALSTGATLGLFAGVILVAQVLLNTRFAAEVSFHPRLVRAGLLAAAGVVSGVAGVRGAKAGGDAGIGMLSGLWCAMAAGLMACTAVLGQVYLAGPSLPQSQDPWKQYEGLAIGNPATQALVNTLNSATWFLLISPIVGATLGLVFALFGQARKD